MNRRLQYLLAGCFMLSNLSAFDASTTAANLDTAIKNANAASPPNNIVSITGPINVTSQVRAVNSTHDFQWAKKDITINGNNQTLNGVGRIRGLFIGGQNSTSEGSVNINLRSI